MIKKKKYSFSQIKFFILIDLSRTQKINRVKHIDALSVWFLVNMVISTSLIAVRVVSTSIT